MSKLETYLANGLSSLDARIASATETKNLLLMRANFVAVHKTLFACNYSLNGLAGNVHGFNTKDAVIARALNGERAYVHAYTECVFKTAYNLHKNNLQLLQSDINAVVCHDYKLDGEKRERDNFYVLTQNKSEAMRDTQKSQTKNSLEYFGVISETGKNAYKFNSDAKATKKLAAFFNCE